jgi:hypothetical protein
MKHCFAMLAAAGVLAFRLPGCPLGPDTPDEILGRVTDASGAVVSGARITAVDNATNTDAASAPADGSGDYLLPFLNPGVYRVSVEMPGFRPFRQDHVTVRAGQIATVDVKIELAALAQGVVNVSGGGTYRPYDNENSSAIAVNGSSAGTHEFLIDAAANTGGASRNVAYVPPRRRGFRIHAGSRHLRRAQRLFQRRESESELAGGRQPPARPTVLLPGKPRRQCRLVLLQSVGFRQG